MMLRSLSASALIAATLASCGPGDGSAGGCAPGSSCCVAFTADFQSYASWESVSVGSTMQGTHAAGLHNVYLNRRPPPGSTTFPVGTIFVKVVQVTSAGDVDLFAMVKRGCGSFNAANDGWEFFRLLRDAQGRVVLPSGGRGAENATLQGTGYSDDPSLSGVTCVNCHGASAQSTDHILGPGLSPAELSPPSADAGSPG